MSTIRFGKACDGDGCSVRFNDYSTGDIVDCEFCSLDLCTACREKTGHRMLRTEVCCEECPGPVATCEPADVLAEATR